MGELKKVVSTVVMAGCCVVWGSPEASAQCCLDIFGWGKSTNTASTAGAMPSFPYGANYAAAPGSYPVIPASGPNLMPGSGMATMPSGFTVPNGYAVPQPYVAGYAGVPQGVANFLPTTNYNTQYFNAAVTYYRPVVTTDPRTGKQVTTMMPCTSYQQQAQRVPACSLGQCLTSSPTPMVAAPPMPTATGSGNVMPPTNVPNTVSYAAPASGYSVPSTANGLPTINPTLPVYNTGGQPAYATSGVPVQANYYSPVNSQMPYGATPGNTAWPTTSNFGTTNPVTIPAPNQSPGLTGGYPTTAPSAFNPSNGTIVVPSIGTGLTGQGSEIYPSSPSSILPTNDGTSGFGVFPPAASPSSGIVNPPNDSESRIHVEPKIPAAPSLEDEKTNDPAAREAPSLPLEGESKKESATEEKSSLNGSGNRLQNVVRQPSGDLRDMSRRSIDRVGDSKPLTDSQPVTSGSRPIQNNVPTQDNSSQSGGRDSLVPELKPIPLPEGFDSEPKWNPGLLNSSDKTASLNKANKNVPKLTRRELQDAAESDSVVWAGYQDRKLTTTTSPTPNVTVGRSASPPPSKSRYDDSGWKTSRGR